MKGRNTNSLVRQVAETLDCTIGEANYFIDLVFHIIKKDLKAGGRFYVKGLGNITTKIQQGYRMDQFLDGKVRTPTIRPDFREVMFHADASLTQLMNEDYQGLESLEELYDTKESRPSPPPR